ncbi:hypothetical protein AN958_12461 [Leucoagaricus sp. SymC.cos]|nr:hypothetical protein AN958_12461 [Leucoagaricus sp. SymC.cos]
MFFSLSPCWPISLLRAQRSRIRKHRLSFAYCTYATDSPSSSVHRGTYFENRSMALLEQHLSMSLRRVGGKGDNGVDMLGWWWIPQLLQGASMYQRRRIRVIAQCKAEKKKLGPKYVRELEGVLHRYHMSSFLDETEDLRDTSSRVNVPLNPRTTSHQHIPSLGLLISESPFTKATVLYAQSSTIPLLLLHIPPETKDPIPSSLDTQLNTAVWNPALAGVQGLLGGHMEIRWERSSEGRERPGLWWRKTRLPNWAPGVTSIVIVGEGRDR